MQKKRDSTVGQQDHSVVRYTSQEEGEEGQEVSKVIGAQCERLEAGAKSESRRENTSAVYHVIDGKGLSTIGDKVIEWVKGDTFTVPSWQPYVHEVSNRLRLLPEYGVADVPRRTRRPTCIGSMIDP
jgi:gentisate 1,2-dioxygenase